MAVLRELLARQYLADDRDISRAIFEWKLRRFIRQLCKNIVEQNYDLLIKETFANQMKKYAIQIF